MVALFNAGDRVVDWALERAFGGKKYFGTVIKMDRNAVVVHWDVDHKDWHDVMYVDELRLATREEDIGGPE